MSLPESIYHVRRLLDKKKPYYGRSDRRIYAQSNHVSQFIGPGGDVMFEIHRLSPGSDWEDVTKEFVCEHHIGVCLECGDEYDTDFEPTLFCHDDESWTVRVEHRRDCSTHRRNK